MTTLLLIFFVGFLSFVLGAFWHHVDQEVPITKDDYNKIVISGSQWFVKLYKYLTNYVHEISKKGEEKDG
jgi:hypothetical protein